jgi:hypothetical protein
MMSTTEVVLCHPVRTAIGAYNGSLKGVTAPDLGAVVVRETIARSGLDPARVDNVVLGNVIQAGNRMNPARQAAIHGGLPVSVPAMTINRVCGSGAQAIWLGPDNGDQGGERNLLPATMREILTKSLTLRGFINHEFAGEYYPAFLQTVSAGIADGRIRYRERHHGWAGKRAGRLHRHARRTELRQGAGARASRAECP